MSNCLKFNLLKELLVLIIACFLLKNSWAQQPKSVVSGDFYAEYGRWDSAVIGYRYQLNEIQQTNFKEEILLRTKLTQAFLHLNRFDSTKIHLLKLGEIFNSRSDSVSTDYLHYCILVAENSFRSSSKSQGEKYHKISSELIFKQKVSALDSALFYINDALFKKNQEKFEDAYMGFEKAKSIYRRAPQKNVVALVSVLNEQAQCYISEREYFKAEACLQEAISLLDQAPHLWKYNWVWTYMNLGYTFNLQDQLSKAITQYEQVQKLFVEYPPRAVERGRLYYSMAILMMTKKNPAKSLEYFRQALPYYGKNKGAHASIYQSMANAFLEKNDLDNALEFIQRSIRLKTQLSSIPKSSLALAYMNQGRIHLKAEKWFSAEESLLLSIEIYEEFAQNSETRLSLPLYFLGELYEKTKRWEEAQITYSRALSISLNSYGKKHSRTAISYGKMATLAQNQNKYKQALSFIQLALSCVFPQDSLNDYFQNPVLKKNDMEKDLFDLLKQKADILQEKAQVYNNEQDLRLSLETYLLAQNWADTMRLQISSEGDKLNYLDKIHGFYPDALASVWQLYQRTQESQFLNHAFQLIEKSKANLLLENLQEGEALKFADIDEDLLKKEEIFRSELKQAENEVFDLERIKTADSILQPLRNQVFQLRQQYDSLKLALEEQHPEYYKLKYDLSVRSIEEVQNNMLADDQAIIEYFVAEDYLYIFFISHEEVIFKRIGDASALVEEVEKLQEGITKWHMAAYAERTDSLQNALKTHFNQSAFHLYKTLVKPIQDSVQVPEKLIIVPDGILGYIPFDLLLSDSVDLSTPYSRYPFLIHEYQISYCYSTTLLSEMRGQEHQKVKHEILGIALSFSDNYRASNQGRAKLNGSLGRLTYTLPEVQAISEIAQTLSLYDSDASKERVESLLGNFHVLHFSTHGILDDKESSLTFLALDGANLDTDLGRLYVRDLYKHRINAELVVLSACEMGLGELYKGEGIMSMARGFSYAGASSIVTTLWQVDDKAAAEIMKTFYQQLKLGKEKDKALRLAKLEYLASASNQFDMHPYYWGASIPIGNMGSIVLDDPSWGWYVWGLIVAVLLGMMFLGYKKFTRV